MKLALTVCFTAIAGMATAQQATLLAPSPDTLFPDNFGGAYELTDHHGNTRTEIDPDGRIQLIFFGYAGCEAICTVALPVMSDVAANLRTRGVETTPLVITVDPERDTVESMGPDLAAFAPGLTGLTGSEDALAKVRDLFHVQSELLFIDPLGVPVYAHGSHIFVMDGAGEFLTLLPPILPPERMVEIVEGYAQAG